MANRILLGDHDNFGYGLFISRPTKDVTTNLDKVDLGMFYLEIKIMNS